jgi:hypothetical protein
MDGEEFLLRVRGAKDSRLYRFSGAEAAELHRLRSSGTLERPGGTHRLSELIKGRDADSTHPSVGSTSGDVHFDMVAEDELRQYMSQRLVERKSGREGGAAEPQRYPDDRPNDPSPA